MGQKMALVHQRLSLLDDGSSISRHIAAAVAADDDDGGFELMDEEHAIDVAQQSMAVDDYNDLDGGEVDFVPLRIMRPENVESEPEKHPGFRYKHKAQRTIAKTYNRKKTGRPASSRYAKRKIEKKRMLVDNSSSSDSKSDNDDDFEPPAKKGWPAGSKSAKRKGGQQVSDDDGRKKYASVPGFYGNALDRALEVEKKLPAEGPSFVKLMQKSHVVKGFLLGVPVSFCREHLPKRDVTIVLEDEDGHNLDTNYLARKQGLSGGWNGFVAQHCLKVGDAVVFQLVGQTRFKVYILRENKFTTTDGALGLLSLDTSMENNIPEKEESLDEDVKSKEDPEVTRVSSKASNDDSNDIFSEEAANGGSADPGPDFDVVKTFITFKIIVDGSVIDRQLVTDRLLWTYCKLCGPRKAFLHRQLSKHIAVGVIMETVNIAEGIRASPASPSSHEDLRAWKRTLESFELLGMDVGFMCKRVDDLLGLLAAQSSGDHLSTEPQGYEEVKLERVRATEKLRALESKMASLKDGLREMDMEMKEIAEKRRGQAMRQLAAAPW